MSAAQVTTSTSSAAESRKQILDHAARLFRTDGYAAVSMRDLAAACGMKAGSLYYHFSSKDEIVAEVLRVGVERVYVEVQRALGQCPRDASPAHVFGVAVRAHLRTLLELHDYTSANCRIFGQVPEPLRAAHVELRDEYERAWTKLLSRFSRPTKDDKERLRLARFFLIGAMNGTLEWFDPRKRSVDEIADHLTRLFLHGLLDKPDKADRPEKPRR